MIQVMNEIPQKQPLIHPLKGRVEYDGEQTMIGGIAVPEGFVKKLLRNSTSYDSLQDAIDEKELYLRGRETTEGVEWFGLVSGQFRPISVQKVSDLLGQISLGTMVRYDEDRERFQVGYVLKNTPKVMVYADSGDFGVYGGNGESALQYGISIADTEPTSWTLFQNQRHEERSTRAIHRLSLPSIDNVVKRQLEFANGVERAWEENRTKMYSRAEVEDFKAAYLDRCATVFKEVLEQMNGSILGEELVAALHEEARRHCSRKQFGLEAVAGEMVMYGK